MTCVLENKSNLLDEKAKKTIRKALKILGKKNLAFIMHCGSFPSAPNQNTGFGSINSDGGKEFIEYASGLFDAIQLGPAGKTKSCDSSPYTGTIFSGNPLFIDLKELTTKAWGKILSEDTYNRIVAENPNAFVPTIFGIPICINLPAIVMVLLSTAILVKGTKDSAKMTAVMVVVKLAVIALFVIAGAFYVKPESWVPFAPHGAAGIFAGAFIIFFAYIGFDAIATAAEECKNPQKDLPIGIIGSLIVTTIVYVLVALILTGLQDTSVTATSAFLKAPMAYCLKLINLNWAAGLVSIGSLAGLTSVLLVMEMAATRILYAMSRDHFISARFQKLHPKFKTPHVLTWTVGLLSVIGILTLNLDVAAELCNYGTFTSFIVVCIAVLILRKTDPNRPRPFKVPFSPVVPSLGIICCGGLMIYKSMQASSSALLFPVWLGIGAMIYLLYGFVRNRMNENNVHNEQVEQRKLELKM